MDVKLSFKQKPFSLLIKSLTLSYILSCSTISAAANEDYYEVRYLNPDVWNIVVTENDCFHAAPKSFIEVEPVTNENGQRVYKIAQYADLNIEKILYAKPLEMQIHDRKIVGDTFCNGIVSISDMNLPFTKGETGIVDANDGLLFADFVRHSINDIRSQLHEMNLLSTDAASGVYSSTQLGMMDHRFQLDINNLDSIAKSSQFDHIFILDGSRNHLDIPVDNGKQHLTVSLTNMTADMDGLNIHNLSIASSYSAQDNLMWLGVGELQIENAIIALKEESRFLEAAAERDATTTLVDAKTDNFTVQRTRPSTVTKQGSKK